MSGMKIPNSIHEIYISNIEYAKQIRKFAGDRLAELAKERDWFFIDRLKSEESFCQKIESGRFDVEFKPTNVKNQIGDLYAATMVVQNLSMVRNAVSVLKENEPYLHFIFMKPRKLDVVYHSPSEFVYDGVRLYFTTYKPIKPDQLDLSFILFEIQVKTFLDYAWGISTHDIGYKGDSFEWGVSRIVAQNKAILDSVELSLSEFNILARNQAVSLENAEFKENQECLQIIKTLWKQIPDDGITLTRNISNLKKVLGISNTELFKIIQMQKAYEYMSLSVYGSILKALIIEFGISFFEKIKDYYASESSNRRSKAKVIIYKEINIDDLIRDFSNIKDRYSNLLVVL